MAKTTILSLFLSLFLNSSLFHCNQEEDSNYNNPQIEAQIHKSIKEIDTLLRDFQQEIKKEESVLRSVTIDENDSFYREVTDPARWNQTFEFEGHIVNSTYRLIPETSTHNLWALLSPSPEIANNSTTSDLNTTSNPLYDSDEAFYKYQTVDPFPPITVWIPPGGIKTLPYSVVENYSPLSPSFSPRSEEDYTAPPTFKETAYVSPPVTVPVLRGTVKPRPADIKMMVDRSGVTPVHEPLREDQMIPTARTLSKAEEWVLNRRWTKSSTPANTLETQGPLLRTYAGAFSTQTGFTADLIHEDKDGFLYVSIPSSLITTPFTITTVAGDVLYNANEFTNTLGTYVSFNQRFHDMMNATDEGYLVVFFICLSDLVAQKEEKHVIEVLQHSELIINKYNDENKLAFAGARLTSVLTHIGLMTTDAIFNIDTMQGHAATLHKIFSDRATTLSPEVNSIIDYADLLFDDSKGEQLLDSLREFDLFPSPKSTKTSWQICFDMIKSIIDPFREIGKTERGMQLMDSINKALSERWDEERAIRRGVLMNVSTAFAKFNRSRTHIHTTPSLKKILEMKRRQLNLTRQEKREKYRRQNEATPWRPIIRSMLPITRRQKRFRVITPRKLRSNLYLNIERPTQENYYMRRRGHTHAPNGMLQFFSQPPVEKKKASRPPTAIVAASEEQPQQTTKKPHHENPSLYFLHRGKRFKQTLHQNRVIRNKSKTVGRRGAKSRYIYGEATLTGNLA